MTVTQQHWKSRKQRKVKRERKKLAKQRNIPKHQPANSTKTTEDKLEEDEDDNDPVRPQRSNYSMTVDSQVNVNEDIQPSLNLLDQAFLDQAFVEENPTFEADTGPQTSLLQEKSAEDNSKGKADEVCAEVGNQNKETAKFDLTSHDATQVSLVHNTDISGMSDIVTTVTCKPPSEASLSDDAFTGGGYMNREYPPEPAEQVITTVQMQPTIASSSLNEDQQGLQPASCRQSVLEWSSPVSMLPGSQLPDNECDSYSNEVDQSETDKPGRDTQSGGVRSKSSQNSKDLFPKQHYHAQRNVSESHEASEPCISCDQPHNPDLTICPPWLEALETARFRRVNGLDQLNECSSGISPVSIEDFEWPNFPGVGFPRARRLPAQSRIGSAAPMLMDSLLKHMKTFFHFRKDRESVTLCHCSPKLYNNSAHEAHVCSRGECPTSMASALFHYMMTSFTRVCYALACKLGWYAKKKA